MKICDLTQSYAATGGGVRTYLHSKIDYIQDHAPHAQHVLIVPGDRDTHRQRGRCSVYTVASPLLPGSHAYRLLFRSDKVSRILRTERPDVVDVHCAYNLPWTALHYRRQRPGARIVGTYMTDLPSAYVQPAAAKVMGKGAGDRAEALAKRYVRALYSRLDATMAISPLLAERLVRLGIPNVCCIPLGVDLETFSPARRDAQLRRELGAGDEDLLLIYAGRLDGEKRAHLVLEAFARLPETLRARLILVGDGPQRQRLVERAAEIGRARVLPFISDRLELARLLASADIYVSMMPFETFGLSVVEAQACGLPVVGVAGGVMPERVPAERGVGRLGPVDDVEAMAVNIREMAREDLAAAGRRARAMVEDQFSWRRTFEQVFSLYDRLLSAPAPRPPAVLARSG